MSRATAPTSFLGTHSLHLDNSIHSSRTTSIRHVRRLATNIASTIDICDLLEGTTLVISASLAGLLIASSFGIAL
jgi:hypothetical protein